MAVDEVAQSRSTEPVISADAAMPTTPGAAQVAGNGARRTSVKRASRRMSWKVAPLLLPALVLLVWELAVVIFKPPEYQLPSIAAVFDAMKRADLQWQTQAWTTVREVVLGYLLAAVVGILLAILVSWNRYLSRAILPSVVVFDTLPKVALVPLFLAYLGFGVLPNLVIAAMIAFFPILISTSTGLQRADENLLDLARSLAASKARVFLRVRLPSAVPYILSGLRIASTLAVTGAVFGEFLAARTGLGSITIQTEDNLQTNVAFAGLVYLGVLGYLLYAIVSWGGRWLFPWAATAEERNKPTNPMT